MIYILFAYYAVMFGLLIATCYKKSLEKHHLTFKLLTSAGFIMIAAYSGFESGEMSMFYKLLPAFVFCFLGDALLAFTDNKGSKKYFLGGLVAFLIGHIMFVIGLIAVTPFSAFELIIPVVTVGIAALLLHDKNMEPGKMTPYIYLYSVFVSWLFSKGLFVYLALQNTASILILIGSALFLISDLIILYLYFYKKKFYLTRFFNLFTYYGGLLLLALSIAFL